MANPSRRGGVAGHFRKALAAVGLAVKTTARQEVTDAPFIEAGSGAASAANPNGSLNLRTDGIPEFRMNSAWNQLFVGAVTTVAMADAAHALVLGTAGAAETQIIGNIIFCDPDSAGASEILTLPAEASSAGMLLIILNTGGEGIVVNDDAAGTIITLDTAQHGLVACDGTTWLGFMGAVT